MQSLWSLSTDVASNQTTEGLGRYDVCIFITLIKLFNKLSQYKLYIFIYQCNYCVSKVII